MSAKRGSCATFGASRMRISSCQNFCVMHITKIQPSCVLNSCTGTADGCALRGVRPVTSRSFRNQVPGYESWCSATSNRQTSRSRPWPPRATPSNVETSARAVVMPVMKSMIERPMRDGGVPGSPVRCRKPASACIR